MSGGKERRSTRRARRLPELLTLEEAAERFRLTPRQVSDYIAQGRLRAIRFARGVTRFEISELLRFIEESRTR